MRRKDDAMAKTMTPSDTTITTGQIGKFQELLGARLRKSGLPSNRVQQVLADQGDAVADEMVATVRARVEAISNMIVRRTRVDRTCNPQQLLNATGRTQHTNHEVVDSMPRGEGEEVDVHFFDLSYNPTPSQLEAEYNFRGLRSDPIAQIQVNIDDPTFADERPNGCQWNLDQNGIASFVAFYRWGDERDVRVDRDYRCYRYYRFGGVRK